MTGNSWEREDRWNPSPAFNRRATPESITKLKAGESFRLENKIYAVQNVFTYTELLDGRTGESWQEFEVICASTSETRYMEVENGGSVVYFTDVAGLELRDVGISDGDELEAIVDAEGNVQGFAYEDDYDARFEFDGRTETLWSVEFKRGSEWLCVEEWDDDDPYEVSRGRTLPVERFQLA